MKTHYIVFFLVFVIVSCQSSSHDPLTDINLSVAKRVNVPTMKNWKGCNYSDFATEVNYIPLEITPYSLLGDINELEIAVNGDLIVLDTKNKQIFRFDSQGKFLNSIGEIGHGHNELIDPVHIAYDSYHNQILVWDNAQDAIYYFDLNGKVTKNIKTGIPYGLVGVIDSTTYCVYSNLVIDNSHYNYTIFDSNANQKFAFESFNLDLNYLPDATHIFQTYKGNLYSKSLYSNIVYKLNANSVEPVFIIDYEDKDNWNTGTANQVTINRQNKNDIFYCKRAIIADNFLFSQIGNHEKSGFAILNLNNDSLYCSQNIKNNLEEYGNSLYYPLSMHNNILYAKATNFDFLVEWMVKRNQTNHPKYEFNKKFSQYGNPIIQAIKLK